MKTNGDEPINCNDGNGFWNDEFNHTHAGVGLTKREYFAAFAMQGVEASNIVNSDPEVMVMKVPDVALRAVQLADALIDCLNKKGDKNGTK